MYSWPTGLTFYVQDSCVCTRVFIVLWTSPEVCTWKTEQGDQPGRLLGKSVQRRQTLKGKSPTSECLNLPSGCVCGFPLICVQTQLLPVFLIPLPLLCVLCRSFPLNSFLHANLVLKGTHAWEHRAVLPTAHDPHLPLPLPDSDV